MSTDPTNFLAALGGAQSLPNSYAVGQQVQTDQIGNQQRQAAATLLGAQAQAAQAQLRENQDYQLAAKAAIADGSPRAIASLITRFPDQHQAIAKGWDIKEGAQKQSDLRSAGEVLSALDNGRPDLAASSMQARIDAEEAAGQDTAQDKQVLAAIKSGDQAAINSARGALRYTLSAVVPDKFAEVLGKVGGDQSKDKGYTLNGDEVRFDGNNNVVARGPGKTAEPHFYTLKDANGVEHEFVYQGGALPQGATMGQPGADSASAAGRTTGGWTPRQRNGGDNPDAAVDNKITGVAKALGVDPSADISTMSPLQIAKALSYGEGGAGSLADRNNNPTNIRNGDGSYKKFASPDAAYTAAAALVARKLKNGQTTVKSLIEGLPVGGGAATQSAGMSGSRQLDATPFASSAASAGDIKSGDITTVPPALRASVQAIADGRSAPPRPGSRNGEALLDAVTAFDPTFDAANATSRVKTRVDFTSGKSAQNITAMNTAMGHLLHLDDQVHDLNNNSIAPGLTNPGRRWVQTNILGNSAYKTFDQTKQAAASEMRKVFAGTSGGNLAELEAWEKTLDATGSPSQLHDVIKNGVDLMASRLGALQDQYVQGMGRSDQIPTFIKPSLVQKARERFGVDLGAGAKAASPADAPPSLPPPGGKQIGTYQGKPVFQMPNGKRVVQQ